MGKVVFGMAISLDGFVNDRNGSTSRLYANFEDFGTTELGQETIETTGAVVMGRRSYELGQGDFTGYEFQTPIFVLTYHPPQQVAKGENENLKFHFVTDGVESTIEQAKAAAGDKNVTVIGGVATAQQLLNAGLVDELEVDIAPVLFSGGQRLFENLDTEGIKLEQLRVVEYRGVTHIKYRIVK